MAGVSYPFHACGEEVDHRLHAPQDLVVDLDFPDNFESDTDWRAGRNRHRAAGGVGLHRGGAGDRVFVASIATVVSPAGPGGFQFARGRSRVRFAGRARRRAGRCPPWGRRSGFTPSWRRFQGAKETAGKASDIAEPVSTGNPPAASSFLCRLRKGGRIILRSVAARPARQHG
jgi:hypothetical protein